MRTPRAKDRARAAPLSGGITPPNSGVIARGVLANVVRSQCLDSLSSMWQLAKCPSQCSPFAPIVYIVSRICVVL